MGTQMPEMIFVPIYCAYIPPKTIVITIPRFYREWKTTGLRQDANIATISPQGREPH